MADDVVVKAGITGDPAELLRAFERSQKGADDFERGMQQSADGADGAMKKAGGGILATFGAIIAMAAIVVGAVAGIGKGLYEVGAAWDDVGDTIRVGTGATGDALAGLMDVADDVATSVPTSLDRIGPAVSTLNTRLGLTGDTLTTVAGQALEAGRILGEELNLENITGSFNAFGIAEDQVAGSMDQLFRISQQTGIGMNELAAKAQAAAPVVANLGFSFDQTTSLIGALDKAGLNSQQMMAGLASGLVQLARDGEQPQQAFERVVGELQGFIETGDRAAALDLAGEVFGTRGASAFIQALDQGTVSLESLMASGTATGDTILGVAAETRDFAENWQLVKNNVAAALEPLGSAVFATLGAVMGSVVDIMERMRPSIDAGIAKAAPFFEKMAEAAGELLPTIIDLWSEFSPFSVILQALMPLLPQIADLFSLLASTLQQSLGPILPILVDVFGQIAGVVLQVAGVVGGALISVLTALMPVIPPILDLFMTLLDALMPLIPPILDIVLAILPLVSVFGDLLGAILPPLVELLLLLVDVALMPLIGVLEQVLPPVLAVVGGLVDYLVPAISMVMDVLAGLINFFVSVFKGDWEGAWNAISGIFDSVWEGMQATAKASVNFIIDVINGLVGAWNGIAGGVSDITGGVIDVRIPKIPHLATGGTAMTDGMALVGERGPELIHLPRGASVVPLPYDFGLDDIGVSSGGSGPQNVTYDIDVHVDGSDREASETGAEIGAAIKFGTGG